MDTRQSRPNEHNIDVHDHDQAAKDKDSTEHKERVKEDRHQRLDKEQHDARKRGGLSGLWHKHRVGQEMANKDFPIGASAERRRLLAEFLGTFWLTFTHAGLTIIAFRTVANNGLDFTGQAIGIGLSLVCLVYALGSTSGAHFNPGITLCFALFGYFSWKRVPLYWMAQFAGGFLAALFLWCFFGDDADVGANYPQRGFSYAQAFFLEALLCWWLYTVALSVAARGKLIGVQGALAIGATLGLNSLVGGPFGGGAMNPARSLGPGIVGGQGRYVWIYLIAPLLAALVATAIMTILIPYTTPEAVEIAQGGGKLEQQQVDEKQKDQAKIDKREENEA